MADSKDNSQSGFRTPPLAKEFPPLANERLKIVDDYNGGGTFLLLVTVRSFSSSSNLGKGL